MITVEKEKERTEEISVALEEKTTPQGVQPRPPKDMWDKLTAVAPIISGLLIFMMGGWCTYSFNQQQLKLQEIQTIEKFIPHLMGNDQSKEAAILAIRSLTNAELASKFASIFASRGTVSALQSMAETGTEHEKNVASQALAKALEALADRETKLSEAENAYKTAVATNEQKDEFQLVHELSGLAELYRMKGQYELAEPLLQRSLALRKHLYGSSNPQVAEALRSLSALYKLQNKGEQADEYLARAQDIDKNFTVKPANEPTTESPNEAEQENKPALAKEISAKEPLSPPTE